MTDKRIYKNKLLVPFSISILFILHPKETSDRNIIVIDYLFKPFGVHNYDFLTTLIYNLLLFDIFKWCPVKSSIYAFRDNYGFRSEERRVGKECRSRWSPYH